MIQTVKWDWELKPEKKWFQLEIMDIFKYKGLIKSFVRRELIAGYQQTIMGICWLVLQPLFTTLFFFLIFSRIVKVSTDGIPPLLFYMSGSIIWSFFSDCLSSSMYSFVHNAHIFNKVYFPRIIVPLSMVLTHTVRFLIQFIFFVIIYSYYTISGKVQPSIYMLLLPFLLVLIGTFAIGIGMIVSIFMAKYRDIEQIMNFLLRFVMFVTPVVYPASIISKSYQIWFWLNPLTPILETFRTAFFGTPLIYPNFIWISMLTVIGVFFVALVVFKKNEIKVMDTL